MIVDDLPCVWKKGRSVLQLVTINTKYLEKCPAAECPYQ